MGRLRGTTWLAVAAVALLAGILNADCGPPPPKHGMKMGKPTQKLPKDTVVSRRTHPSASLEDEENYSGGGRPGFGPFPPQGFSQGPPPYRFADEPQDRYDVEESPAQGENNRGMGFMPEFGPPKGFPDLSKLTGGEFPKMDAPVANAGGSYENVPQYSTYPGADLQKSFRPFPMYSPGGGPSYDDVEDGPSFGNYGSPNGPAPVQSAPRRKPFRGNRPQFGGGRPQGFGAGGPGPYGGGGEGPGSFGAPEGGFGGGPYGGGQGGSRPYGGGSGRPSRPSGNPFGGSGGDGPSFRPNPFGDSGSSRPSQFGSDGPPPRSPFGGSNSDGPSYRPGPYGGGSEGSSSRPGPFGSGGPSSRPSPFESDDGPQSGIFGGQGGNDGPPSYRPSGGLFGGPDGPPSRHSSFSSGGPPRGSPFGSSSDGPGPDGPSYRPGSGSFGPPPSSRPPFDSEGGPPRSPFGGPGGPGGPDGPSSSPAYSFQNSGPALGPGFRLSRGYPRYHPNQIQHDDYKESADSDYNSPFNGPPQFGNYPPPRQQHAEYSRHHEEHYPRGPYPTDGPGGPGPRPRRPEYMPPHHSPSHFSHYGPNHRRDNLKQRPLVLKDLKRKGKKVRKEEMEEMEEESRLQKKIHLADKEKSKSRPKREANPAKVRQVNSNSTTTSTPAPSKAVTSAPAADSCWRSRRCGPSNKKNGQGGRPRRKQTGPPKIMRVFNSTAAATTTATTTTTAKTTPAKRARNSSGEKDPMEADGTQQNAFWAEVAAASPYGIQYAYKKTPNPAVGVGAGAGAGSVGVTAHDRDDEYDEDEEESLLQPLTGRQPDSILSSDPSILPLPLIEVLALLIQPSPTKDTSTRTY